MLKGQVAESKLREQVYQCVMGKYLGYMLVDQILNLFKEAGYRKLPKDKPPLLSDEKKAELWKQAQRDGSNPYNEFTPDELMTELVAYAQREADIKFHG